MFFFLSVDFITDDGGGGGDDQQRWIFHFKLLFVVVELPAEPMFAFRMQYAIFTQRNICMRVWAVRAFQRQMESKKKKTFTLTRREKKIVSRHITCANTRLFLATSICKWHKPPPPSASQPAIAVASELRNIVIRSRRNIPRAQRHAIHAKFNYDEKLWIMAFGPSTIGLWDLIISCDGCHPCV